MRPPAYRPEALTSVLNQYCAVLELDAPSEGPYLFHPPQSKSDRPLEASAWTGWVRRLFKRHHGTEVAPKTLRSVFITWLRDSTDAPAVLKSAAHAMKHSEARQASGDYDQAADDRLVKAAYDFNLKYCAKYTMEPQGAIRGEASGAAGSSTAHGAVAAAPAAAATIVAPRPSRPGKEAGMAAARAMANGAAFVAPVVQGAPEVAVAVEEAQAPQAAEAAPMAMEGAEAAPMAEAAPPLNDAQIAQRLAALHCEWVDASQTELRGTHETDVDALRVLLDEMGADSCALLTHDRIYRFQRSEYGQQCLGCTSEQPEGLADDAWQSLEGGPWQAKLMRPSRQPVAHATYRNFYVSIAFDPSSTPLTPGGQIKFPTVAGAPAEGIVCQLPSFWTGRTRQLIFKLKLSKGVPTAASTCPIFTAIALIARPSSLAHLSSFAWRRGRDGETGDHPIGALPTAADRRRHGRGDGRCDGRRSGWWRSAWR